MPHTINLRGRTRSRVAQLGVPGQTAGPVQMATQEGTPVGLEGPIATSRVGTAGELAADRGGRPSHQGGDVAHRALLAAQVGEADPLVFGQVARRVPLLWVGADGNHGRQVHHATHQLDATAVAPARAGAPTDSNHPACPGRRDSLRN